MPGWGFDPGTPQGEYPASVTRAAIITEIPRLMIQRPTGLFFNRDVPLSPGQPGHWGYVTA